MIDWCYICSEIGKSSDMVKLTPKWNICKSCDLSVTRIKCISCQISFSRDSEDMFLTFLNSPICSDCLGVDYTLRNSSTRG